MYFTKILINKNSRQVLQIITDLQEAHRFVMAGFTDIDSTTPRKDRNILFTMDMNKSDLVIFVQSDNVPDNTRYMQNPFVKSAKTMDITKLIDMAVIEGKILRFKTVVNAAINKTGNSGEYRYRVTKATEFDQWIRRKMIGCDLITWNRVDREVITVNHGSQKFDIYKDTIEGAVKVTDPEKFKQIISSGIGKSKAYGCGMIRIA